MSLPRDLIENDWFQTIADWNPVSYMLEGIPLVDDRRLGPRGDRARVRLCGRGRARRPGRRLLGAADPDGADVSRGGFMSVARAVGWRNVHNWFSNPALLIPSLLFPLFFFTAFAGGLSRVDSVPGFDYDAGYTTFVYGFVLLQAAAFGGVFTAFSIARDFESGFSRRLMLAAADRRSIIGELLARRAHPGDVHDLGDHRDRPDPQGSTSTAGSSTSRVCTCSCCS